MRKPLYYLDTFFEVSNEKLEKNHKRIIFLDADNTLFLPKVPLSEQNTKEIRKKLLKLKADGYIIIIISNNFSLDKEEFFDELGIPAIFFAKKPLIFSFKKAHLLAEEIIEEKIEKDKIIHIGDQFLTDAIGSALFKIDYILLKPIDENKDLVFAKPSRFLEKVFNIHQNKE